MNGPANGIGKAALGSLLGAAIAGCIAPFTKGFFPPPGGGVGVLTLTGYPKSWDYFVVALVVLGAFVGGSRSAAAPAAALDQARPDKRAVAVATALLGVLMLFIHDDPYRPMDHFHEGEHLTAGWLLKSGERPYEDFFIFHGLAADAGLDALVLGDPPSPRRVRRLQTVLDAVTLALLVPIAAELTATTAGMMAAALVTLSGCAAFWIPVFPYYRLLPVFLAVLGLLRYARSGRAGPLFLAMASSTLGVLWSLDTGMYALAGTAFMLLLMRPKRALLFAAIALAMPLLVLLALRADIGHFVRDSFVILPSAIDAVWGLPAPQPFTANGIRYFLPLVFYGFLLALALRAWRRGDKLLALQLCTIAVFSGMLFRTAAGRVSWSHTRFAVPLLGIAVVAFVVEPLFRQRKWIAAGLLAIPLFVYFEIAENVANGTKLAANWRKRQSHAGLVPYPFATGKGIYTSEQNAKELAALNGFLHARGEGTILDFSNERALHYLMQRKSPLRCMEISMLSSPRLLAEAMAQLEASPPVAVIVEGDPNIAAFDGVSNRQRVPELARWIDRRYPVRHQIGRFLVATP